MAAFLLTRWRSARAGSALLLVPRSATFCLSSSMTAGSRSVVTSPSSRPSAMSRSSRRMILPERVLGRSPDQMIRLGDLRVRDDRRLDLGRGQTMARDVDHVVDASDDPEVAVGVLARGVADQVRLLAEAREVRLDEAVLVAIQGAQHPRPRLAEGQQALVVDLVAVVVDHRG